MNQPASNQAVTIVALKGDNSIGFRTYPTYEAGVRYLERHLPQRKNLDMVDQDGQFVAWEFSATNVAGVVVSIDHLGSAALPSAWPVRRAA